LRNQTSRICATERAVGKLSPQRRAHPPRHFQKRLMFITLMTPVFASAQISPGALSRAHQSLDGATDCTSCHKLSMGTASFRCLECHNEIASRLKVGHGLHASYKIKPDSSQECATCHSEHNGEDFPLIKWDIRTFDHRQTGYALDGKHAGLACEKCHSAGRIRPDQRATIKVKDLNETFLGLSSSCNTCHEDAHQSRLGADCIQCHNFNDWKTVKGGKFDHSRTRYPLIGLHAQVACQQCHTPGSDSRPRYNGIAYGKCTDCHSDPHRGEFQQTCQSCHSLEGWKKVSPSALHQSVDHSKTKFQLLGKHAEVGCVQCHASGDFNRPLAFGKCVDCHMPDPHAGQFANRLDRGECSSCHTVDGFKPAKFGLKEHSATAYPLEGKHATLQCAQCHVPKGKATIYKLKFAQCTECHRDQHSGQFAAKPYLNACERCHNVQRFLPSTFGLARHKDTRFALTGSHLAVACSDCHKQSGSKSMTLYHWQSLACTICHLDPHRGQFDKLMRSTRPSAAPTGCEVCHSTLSWNEFSHFDHAKTAFPLLGGHQTASCISCHKPQDRKLGVSTVDFKTAPAKCESCHEDIHGKQFAQAGVTVCAGCHDSSKWKPSRFDHDTRTPFPLQGAHGKTSCSGCHKLIRTVAGMPVLFYEPTPKDCAACHQSGVLRTTAALYQRPWTTGLY
jgi:hypothetical protein